MKVLQVVSLGYLAGGAEANVLLIRDAIRLRGDDVKVLSCDTHIPGVQMFSDYQYKAVSENSPFKFFHHLFYFRSYREMRHAIKDFGPDVIHFHTLTALSPSAVFAARNIPSVLTIHGPEEFTLKLLPWFLPPYNYKGDPFDLKNLTTLGKFHYFYYRFIQRPIYLHAFKNLEVIIAPSQYIANIISDEIPSANVVQIYNGIDLPSPKPLPKNRRILYVGRLEEVKGVDYLMRAFKDILIKVPDAELHIVGDGRHRQKLEKLSTDLGIEKNIVFLGWISAKERLIKEYGDALVLAIPSIWPENLPTVCIEALAIGRPIVGTQTGGIPELIKDGETGYIVPIKDVKSLGDALIKILLSDDKILAMMSRSAAEKGKKFNMERFINHIEPVYRAIYSAKNSS